MRNKKGLVDGGVTFILTAIVSTVAASGVLFNGLNPIGSGFFLTTSALVAYSQQPHVVRDFRERKAVEEFGIPQSDAEALSDSDLLALIRDDDMSTGNGGNFSGGYMN